MQELSEQQGLSLAVSNTEQLRHFKALVKSLMGQAESIIADMELSAQGSGMEEKIAMLDHCIDYTRRLCEYDPSAS